ncbi:unnamed protein product [Spirodela intermedia]|uniref:DRBM domain-containing protein n=1 Tax=Spirodela intermedia TaxID=51605 RepID=A0A7I8KMZ7_SPIIN|nr:unnamed protein product [Spirodela intermedia]
MYKNQLQELAQRSCFNLPSYACVREGPDHSPRFKATVTFNGEAFESPSFHSTLRQAEHAAAEAALTILSKRSSSKSLTSRVLDETGIYKNLLQEAAQWAGLNLPAYTTIRSGPSRAPSFLCTVDLAGVSFTGEPAKTKKQAQKNAAMAAWASLKRLPSLHPASAASSSPPHEEQERVNIVRALADLHASNRRRVPVQSDGHRGGQPEDPDSFGGVFLHPVNCWAYPNYLPQVAWYPVESYRPSLVGQHPISQQFLPLGVNEGSYQEQHEGWVSGAKVNQRFGDPCSNLLDSSGTLEIQLSDLHSPYRASQSTSGFPRLTPMVNNPPVAAGAHSASSGAESLGHTWPPSVAPVMIRTAVPACSARPRVPAVQIRSVGPTITVRRPRSGDPK